MEFNVKQLFSQGAHAGIYHLFQRDALTMVAEFGSPWSSDEGTDEIRFSRPSGDQLAILTLSSDEPQHRNGRIHTDYALILDFAVYAIFNEYRATSDETLLYFTLEADGLEWMMLKNDDGDAFLIYDQIPPDLTMEATVEMKLSEPVGSVNHLSVAHYDYAVDLPAGRLNHLSLVALTLAVLIDRVENVPPDVT